jgi:hypothetical protein
LEGWTVLAGRLPLTYSVTDNTVAPSRFTTLVSRYHSLDSSLTVAPAFAPPRLVTTVTAPSLVVLLLLLATPELWLKASSKPALVDKSPLPLVVCA